MGTIESISCSSCSVELALGEYLQNQTRFSGMENGARMADTFSTVAFRSLVIHWRRDISSFFKYSHSDIVECTILWYYAHGTFIYSHINMSCTRSCEVARDRSMRYTLRLHIRIPAILTYIHYPLLRSYLHIVLYTLALCSKIDSICIHAVYILLCSWYFTIAHRH